MAGKIATLEDFESLKLVTGLVPMRHLDDTLTDSKGAIRGYTPDVALSMYQIGMAEPYGNAGFKPSGKPTDPDAGTVQESEADKRKSGIAIPENWREQHHLKNIALAKDIVGDKDRAFTKEQAETEIQGELDRRQRGVTGGPNAVTSNALRASS